MLALDIVEEKLDKMMAMEVRLSKKLTDLRHDIQIVRETYNKMRDPDLIAEKPPKK